MTLDRMGGVWERAGWGNERQRVHDGVALIEFGKVKLVRQFGVGWNKAEHGGAMA